MASSPQSPPPPPPPWASTSPLSPPPTCSPGDNSSVVAVVSPCAACKILRRRCVDKCVLAPYFPATDPYKFTIAHRVFGAANIIKFLQELPESQRADAASSMVYEAHARLRDPVYGCAGAICQLQKQIGELKAELAKTQAEAVNIQCQNSNLISLICMEMTKIDQAGDTTSHCTDAALQQQQQHTVDTSCFLDESSLGCCSGWEPF